MTDDRLSTPRATDETFKHEDYPQYQIRLKEPKLGCDDGVKSYSGCKPLAHACVPLLQIGPAPRRPRTVIATRSHQWSAR